MTRQDYPDGALDHGIAPKSFGRAFAIGIGLNLAYVIIEGVYGVLSHSIALIADAGHNLSDVLGLAVAWGAAIASKRLPTSRFTYGLRGSSILAALFNAVFLLIVVGAIGWEAVRRFWFPAEVSGLTVMIVAGIGIVVNAVTAWLFFSGQKGDINIRGAFLHMAADAAVSAAVVIAGLVILYTGWTWLDPLASLLIVCVIVIGTWSLLRESVAMALDAVPDAIEPSSVADHLQKLPGVASIHDLHIWSVSTTEIALTVHLYMPGGHPSATFLVEAAAGLNAEFNIAHATFQVETEPGVCPLEPKDVL